MKTSIMFILVVLGLTLGACAGPVPEGVAHTKKEVRLVGEISLSPEIKCHLAEGEETSILDVDYVFDGAVKPRETVVLVTSLERDNCTGWAYWVGNFQLTQ